MAVITTVTAPPAARRSTRDRAGGIGGWAARVVLAVQFVAGGGLKLLADPRMVSLFDDIGAGQGLRVVVGVCEVAGGVGVIIPWTARRAAIGLAALMVGAATCNVVVLHTSSLVPLVLLGLALVAVRRAGRGDGR